MPEAVAHHHRLPRDDQTISAFCSLRRAYNFVEPSAHWSLNYLLSVVFDYVCQTSCAPVIATRAPPVMADVLPQIRVTANSQEGISKASAVPRSRSNDATNATSARAKSPENIDARPLSRTSKLLPNFSNKSTNASNDPISGEGRRDSQTIDPLSHAIFKRTNTQNTQASKMRSPVPSEDDFPAPEPGASIASSRTSTEPTTRVESVQSGPKEKKNKVSFFSRFAPKKKDLTADLNEDASEAGDRRTEGMDADVFSQPIGYIPQFPPPPKYIKVRSHGKKEKEFNRVFLAQELRGRTGVEIAQAGGRLVKNGAYKPGDSNNAIWAMEFSKDGKYLAAGGKDYVVRVWAVLSSKEDRQAHELEEDAAGRQGESVRLNAPVFKRKTVQEYSGHTASVLDLSWSKNNFLLSSSMDKTVRLWHVTREECLCCFKHSDFVTSIQFHPRDDRFFLAGSLDSKLRLWSIPDKSVAFSVSLPDLITAVAFSPDGKTSIAGCLNGLCSFFETEGLKYQTQIHVRSAHGKNAKGSKVTGIQAINFPPDDPNGEVKLLITSNDSRVRVYNLRDKGLELKLKGNENSCSQIHASFSDDAKYIICGSEDRKAYIWSTGQCETEKDKRPVDTFEAHSAIVTAALMAPIKTRKILSVSGDPLYDLCNPPPVTLVSRARSHTSSRPATDDDQQRPGLPETPATSDSTKITKPEESPAYLNRCAHPGGNIIVTADFNGRIKVFRQDCAYQNRLRNNDSALSKKMLGRTNSVATKHSNRSRRDSLSKVNNLSSDRILSWRQSINSTTGSIESARNPNGNGNGKPLNHKRSDSPRKSVGQASLASTTHTVQRHPPSSQPSSIFHTPQIMPSSVSPQPSPPHRSLADSNEDLGAQGEPFPQHSSHLEPDAKRSYAAIPLIDREKNPLMLQGEQSYMFWNRSGWQAQAAAVAAREGYSGANSTVGSSNGDSHDIGHLGVPLSKGITNVSRLSSEEGSSEERSGEEDGGKGR